MTGSAWSQNAETPIEFFIDPPIQRSAGRVIKAKHLSAETIYFIFVSTHAGKPSSICPSAHYPSLFNHNLVDDSSHRRWARTEDASQGHEDDYNDNVLIVDFIPEKILRLSFWTKVTKEIRILHSFSLSTQIDCWNPAISWRSHVCVLAWKIHRNYFVSREIEKYTELLGWVKKFYCIISIRIIFLEQMEVWWYQIQVSMNSLLALAPSITLEVRFDCCLLLA